MNADLSSLVDLPFYSHHHPINTEAHQMLEAGLSDFSFWSTLLEIANENTPLQDHIDPNPVSNVPFNSNHHSTHSLMGFNVPTYSPSAFLETHIPTSSSSETSASFGLPILWFNKKYLRAAGHD
jgi:hypothetical protein